MQKVYFFCGILIVCFCFVVLLLAGGGYDFDLIFVLVILCFIGLIPFVASGNKVLFSPGRLFAVSVFSFILSRPVIYLFSNKEIVEVGQLVDVINLSKTLAAVALSISISSIFYVSTSCGDLIYKKWVFRSRFKIPGCVRDISFFAFIGFGFYFFYRSWVSSSILIDSDYFQAVKNPDFHGHLKYFFLSKFFAILWIFLDQDKLRIRLASLLVLCFSIGFLFVGMRGYFVAYFFLFVYFYNEKYDIKLFYLIFGSLLFLYGSSFILEYRLGYSIHDDVFGMILAPIHQQGASFEVVFGAVVFPERLSSCISAYDFLARMKSFGDCVDWARGVPFADGGFASSYFAEGYYLGVIPYVAISALMGVVVKLMDGLSVISVGVRSGRVSFVAAFILFLVIPNLVYFARSGFYDLLLKFFMSCAVVLFFYKISFSSDDGKWSK